MTDGTKMPPTPYATIMKAKDKRLKFDSRRALVRDALELGIKPTARLWGVSRNTVRKWLRRYQAGGLRGLAGRSRAPHRCPHKIAPQLEELIVRRREESGFGPRRLVREFDLPCGHGAVYRVLKERGLLRKRRTRRIKKNDLRAVKAKLAAFQTVQMDVKYLNDIANYLPLMNLRGLPGFQYTIRDVRTGLLFVSVGMSLSKTLACLAVERFVRHLSRHGVDPGGVTIQTDNGTEFDGQNTTRSESGFVATVERAGASHRFIPPGCSNANADVESSHSLIETEFYDRERPRTVGGLLNGLWTYQSYFNLARPNSYQGWKTPLERLEEAAPQIDRRVSLLKPVLLDSLMPRPGKPVRRGVEFDARPSVRDCPPKTGPLEMLGCPA